ncbi:MAG: aminotransferase class V-fold PLP-dependent enzyme [Pseudomonadota bacterium]
MEIYLDANATSPVLPAAAAAAEQAMRELYANPSSSHAAGLKAKALLCGVRELAARLLGVGEGSLMFTSGATEGIQTAVLSALCAIRARRARGEATGTLLLYGATEHKAVSESLAHWNALLGTGLELRALPVDRNGLHRLDILRELAPQAAMLCTMAANNETGVISDIAAIEAVLTQTGSGALWMVDSVQALGKLHIDLAATRIDYAPFSGHKLYAPKGVGMLYVRAGSPYTALMAGGGQEGGLRAGTENMAGIAALGAVLGALADGRTFRTRAELEGFRERIAQALRMALPGIVFNPPFAHALPTTLNFSVPGFSSKELLDLFDASGVRVSAGSACSAAKAAPSYVLEAMDLPQWRCQAAVRMSFGPLADSAFIDAACARIARCGEALRSTCLVPSGCAPAGAEGVIQFNVDGACTWVVLDAASKSCVIIDPQAALGERIGAYLRCQSFRVQALVATSASHERAAFEAFVAGELAGGASADPLGWPADSERVVLGDGSSAACVALGQQVLARLTHADGSASYLLGARSGAALPADAVRFAFTGAAALPGGLDAALPLPQLRAAVQRVASLIERDTVLCGARDDDGSFCTTAGTEGQGNSLLAELLALQPRLARAVPLPFDGSLLLEASGLDAFFAAHPNALLIDVREPFEFAADQIPAWRGHVPHNVPLSRLAGQLGHWLHGERVPLVFFCRTGNRSGKAAACLHRLGYPNVRNVVGGLALGDHGPAALALAA